MNVSDSQEPQDKLNNSLIRSNEIHEATNHKRNSKFRSDALIVAALMGNSCGIPNGSVNDKKKLKSQFSAPVTLNVSPVFQGDTPSQVNVNNINT